MSGFDENPFGEPVFADPFKVNRNIVQFEKFSIFFRVVLSYLVNSMWLMILQDPSIQQVAQNNANIQNLDEYDPFGNPPAGKTQPPTLQTSNQTLPAYSPSGQQYQVNDVTANSAGSGVTQISTAELQVSHQSLFLVHRNSSFDESAFLMLWHFFSNAHIIRSWG